jgi:hypothetical protein
VTRVVDTNVILVANLAHPDVSPECVVACVKYLKTIMDSGTVVVDDSYRILLEYQRKTSPHKAKGVGDIFVKWVQTNLSHPTRVHQISITDRGGESYVEFPCAILEQDVDPSDRKFVAVAHAHPDRPLVGQASDCKWLDWWAAAAVWGVVVEFLCHDDVCKFYSRKYPRKEVPALP